MQSEWSKGKYKNGAIEMNDLLSAVFSAILAEKRIRITIEIEPTKSLGHVNIEDLFKGQSPSDIFGKSPSHFGNGFHDFFQEMQEESKREFANWKPSGDQEVDMEFIHHAATCLHHDESQYSYLLQEAVKAFREDSFDPDVPASTSGHAPASDPQSGRIW